MREGENTHNCREKSLIRASHFSNERGLSVVRMLHVSALILSAKIHALP
jgi:hypothetical protein